MQSTGNGTRPSDRDVERLWRAWKHDGDQAARNRLVLSYAPMVKYLAVRKARELPAHCDLDDLVSSGLVALIAACDRWDPTKGASFEHFAWTRIDGAILDELRRLDWAPRALRHQAKTIDQARDRWQAKTSRDPSDCELASEAGITTAELRDTLAQLQRATILPLDTSPRDADDNGDAPALDSILAAPTASPETIVLRHEASGQFRRALTKLTPRERLLLNLVYGHGVHGTQAAHRLGISESRVSQILTDTRTKLRRHLDHKTASRQPAG